jgi:hypothetical protein
LGESVRWQCIDGRSITIALGQGDHFGDALVQDGNGRREYVESFDAAIALAKQWRTAP